MGASDATVKLKGGVEMIVPGVVIDGFSDEVYNAIFTEGLKTFLSKGMTGTKEDKITVTDHDKIEAKAKQNLQNLVEGKVKATRSSKAKGVPGPVMVEARRLAKAAIKQEAKRQGIKVSHLDAKDITNWANALLDSAQGAALIAQAKENLGKAGEKSLFEGISLGIHADDRKAEKAQAKADKADAKKAAAAPKPVPQKVGAKPQHVNH